MTSTAPAPCPSCNAPMEVHVFDGLGGGTVALDICFACQGIWFDPQENLKLTPAALVDLFRLLHAHRDAPRQPLASTLLCPHCRRGLAQGFDVVRSGRYITFRCPNRDGRFSTFSAFMVEKGFVRQLSPAEVEDLARRVGTIHCDSCGAPVDLRHDRSCPHCRCAFSLLDPQAVERALAGYARAASDTGVKLPELADALLRIERDRDKALLEARAQGASFLSRDAANVDLWALGVSLVGRWLHAAAPADTRASRRQGSGPR